MASTLIIIFALGSTLAAAQIDRELPEAPEGIQRPDYEPPGGPDEAKTLDGCGRLCLEFPIHIVILTDNHKVDMSESRAREEVGILNRYFVNSKGRRLAAFYYKSHKLYEEIRGVPREECELAYLANEEPYGDGDAFENAFDHCESSDIRDRNAINVYIYDDFVWPTFELDQTIAQKSPGERKTTRPTLDTAQGLPSAPTKDRSPLGGHGRKNGHQPYILLDYERLPHVQAAEEHEMGHAFGLQHVCDPAVVRGSPSNIMQSSCDRCTSGVCCHQGTGGLRDLGFGTVSHDQMRCTFDQVAAIVANARKYQAAWCAAAQAQALH